MNQKLKKYLYVLTLMFPFLTFAASAPTTFAGLINIIICLALDIVPVIVLIAFVEFLRGLINYVSAGDNEEKRSEGIKFMIYGMIGFFVIVGVWGILKLFTSSFNVTFGIPQFKGSGQSSLNTDSCSSLF